jgi:hypothetical protein
MPPLYSDESLVMDQLKRLKHDKWGYVIYRCTYEDDAAWDRFKQIVHERTQEDLQDSDDTPELADYLEWTFVEDSATLDGASIPRLRERFNLWAAEAVVAENPRARIRTPDCCPTAVSGRYNCFIHVDEEALQSVVAAPGLNRYSEPGYVNLVNSLWEPMGDRYYDHGYDPDDPLNEVLEPIDGCVEENVGWMRVQLRLAFSAYLYVGAGDAESWYLSYRRPPEVFGSEVGGLSRSLESVIWYVFLSVSARDFASRTTAWSSLQHSFSLSRPPLLFFLGHSSQRYM